MVRSRRTITYLVLGLLLTWGWGAAQAAADTDGPSRAAETPVLAERHEDAEADHEGEGHDADGHDHEEDAASGDAERIPGADPREVEIPEGAERVVVEIDAAGNPVEGAATHQLGRGTTLALVVRSEVGGELHLHGLEGSWTLVPDEALVAVLDADAFGRFPMEFHATEGERDVTVAYLEVRP